MADHNDPNAVNSVFTDVDTNGADLYDIFGFPANAEGDKVVVALTFSSVPSTGVLDPDVLYRIRFAADERSKGVTKDKQSLAGMLQYLETIKHKYASILKSFELRVKVDENQKAHLNFMDFPCGSFTARVDTNESKEIMTPDGQTIKVFVGGRDDAFFNDLPGFFRSINYAPQFYFTPSTRMDARETPIPKTFLELEGNDAFNLDPNDPDWGYTSRRDLPKEEITWAGNRFAKNANGNYRFVYSGRDARHQLNVNAIILEIPLSALTKTPETHRVVNTWAESWVRRASGKVPMIKDHDFWLEHPIESLEQVLHDDELKNYKLVDTDGQAFADAALSEREDSRQRGANNLWLAPHFVNRLAHLGWGFGPSVSALGVACAFDHDNSPVSVHKKYHIPLEGFPRVEKILFQELNMPDDSWNPKGLDIPLRRPIEVFIPNVCAIDMDTNGTWPFGRRLEDQVASRFLTLFLDMTATFNGKPYHVDILNDQALWDALPIEPKTPPNPVKNDKDFLPEFPYLAEPWPNPPAGIPKPKPNERSENYT